MGGGAEALLCTPHIIEVHDGSSPQLFPGQCFRSVNTRRSHPARATRPCSVAQLLQHWQAVPAPESTCTKWAGPEEHKQRGVCQHRRKKSAEGARGMLQAVDRLIVDRKRTWARSSCCFFSIASSSLIASAKLKDVGWFGSC